MSRIDDICRDVKTHRDLFGYSAHDAVYIVAGQHGIAPATVRRYMRRQREDQIAGTTTIERKTATYVDPGAWHTHPLKILAIGDLHISPQIDNARLKALGVLARNERVDGVVFIGDICTFDSLTRYIPNDSHSAWTEKPTFQEDIDALSEGLCLFDEGLGDHELILKHLTRGNHEERIESWSEKHPEIYGMLGMKLDRLLDSHGITYSEYGDVQYFGGVGFVHVPLNEMGKPYGGKTAEQRIANDVMHDLVIGHSHRARMHTGAKIGNGKSVRVLNLGCALPTGHIEKYAKHSATGWTYGAWLLTVQNGRIVEHRFVHMDTIMELL